MKKLFLALVLVAGTFFCNAQVFVGGNIGLGLQGGKTETTLGSQTSTVNSPKVTTFEINPFVGFMFDEKFGVGLDFGYGISSSKTEGEILGQAYTAKDNVSAWTVAPFFRWVFGNFEKVQLYADAKVSFAGANTITKTTVGDNTDKTNGPKGFEWGVAIVPGITYMLTDNLSLNGKINVLSLGYSSMKVTTQLNGSDNKSVETTNNFGIGVNESTPISLGLVYTF